MKILLEKTKILPLKNDDSGATSPAADTAHNATAQKQNVEFYKRTPTKRSSWYGYYDISEGTPHTRSKVLRSCVSRLVM